MELEVVVRIVLNQDQVMVLSNRKNIHPSLDRHGRACGVLSGGDQIDNARLGLIGLLGGRSPVIQEPSQSSSRHTLTIRLNRNMTNPQGVQCFECGGVSPLFNKDLVASVAE